MIKKVLITAIICATTLGSAVAQKKFQQELSVGASFGTTFSTVSFSPTKVQQKMK